MIAIDTALLSSLGIKLTPNEEEKFVNHVQESLQERVGLALIEELDDENAAILLELSETSDQTTVNEWLQGAIPDYRDHFGDEFDILMGEVVEHAGQLA